jgi:hypothetical protein
MESVLSSKKNLYWKMERLLMNYAMTIRMILLFQLSLVSACNLGWRQEDQKWRDPNAWANIIFTKWKEQREIEYRSRLERAPDDDVVPGPVYVSRDMDPSICLDSSVVRQLIKEARYGNRTEKNLASFSLSHYTIKSWYLRNKARRVVFDKRRDDFFDLEWNHSDILFSLSWYLSDLEAKKRKHSTEITAILGALTVLEARLQDQGWKEALLLYQLFTNVGSTRNQRWRSPIYEQKALHWRSVAKAKAPQEWFEFIDQSALNMYLWVRLRGSRL